MRMNGHAGGTLVCHGAGCSVWLQAVTLDGCKLVVTGGAEVTLSHCNAQHAPVAVFASGAGTRLAAGDCEVVNNTLGACAEDGAQLLLSRVTVKGTAGHGVEVRGAGSCLQARQCHMGAHKPGLSSTTGAFVNCVYVHRQGAVHLHACTLKRMECGLRAEGPDVVAEARGCSIKGASRCGVRVGPGAAAWVEGCSVRGTKEMHAYGAVVTGASARMDLLDCSIADNWRAAVSVRAAAACGLRGCTMSGSKRSSGIHIDGDGTFVEAADCVIRDNQSCGLGVRSGGRAELRGCSLTGPKQAFGVSASGSKSHVRLSDCTLNDNRLCGLRVAKGSSAVAQQCTLGGSQQRVGLQASGDGTEVHVEDCMLRGNIKCGARASSGSTLHLSRCTICGTKCCDGLHVCDSGTLAKARDCALHDNRQSAACVWKGAHAKIVDCALSGTKNGCGLHAAGEGTEVTIRRCTLGENSVAAAHVSGAAAARLMECEAVGTRAGHGVSAVGAGTRIELSKCHARSNAYCGFFVSKEAVIEVSECSAERNWRMPGAILRKSADMKLQHHGTDKGAYGVMEHGLIVHVSAEDAAKADGADPPTPEPRDRVVVAHDSGRSPEVARMKQEIQYVAQQLAEPEASGSVAAGVVDSANESGTTGGLSGLKARDSEEPHVEVSLWEDLPEEEEVAPVMPAAVRGKPRDVLKDMEEGASDPLVHFGAERVRVDGTLSPGDSKFMSRSGISDPGFPRAESGSSLGRRAPRKAGGSLGGVRRGARGGSLQPGSVRDKELASMMRRASFHAAVNGMQTPFEMHESESGWSAARRVRALGARARQAMSRSAR